MTSPFLMINSRWFVLISFSLLRINLFSSNFHHEVLLHYYLCKIPWRSRALLWTGHFQMESISINNAVPHNLILTPVTPQARLRIFWTLLNKTYIISALSINTLLYALFRSHIYMYMYMEENFTSDLPSNSSSYC